VCDLKGFFQNRETKVVKILEIQKESEFERTVLVFLPLKTL